ncbi:hypothetical protein [Maricaulis parjimensis]|uniref:hypothetical protein n=1 Tax=Maricaulis parjimensis TaxID=144023 RepID=UPI00193A717F|nr:hypothetical protein [Maricaulis parjimensis]
MRILAVVLMGLTLSSQALSQEAFDARYESLAPGSIEIGRIGYSDELRQKAALLGESELTRLAGYLREDLEAALISTDWHGIALQATVLNVTLIDVVPNRPTLTQLQRMPNLSYASHTPGGADLTAELVDESGEVIARYTFSWHDPDASNDGDSGVWTDTRTAFAHFSERLVQSLGDAPMPGLSGT